MRRIQAVPATYRGITFRSTLEANWAATFDTLGWTYWSYEPEAVEVAGQRYLCDFYLYSQRLWCEVKGPHDERIGKPRALQHAFDVEFTRANDEGDLDVEWWIPGGPAPLVVILRSPGPGDTARWDPASAEHDIQLARCVQCQNYYFMDANQDWSCRHGCDRKHSEWYGSPFSQTWRSGEFPFTRSTRRPGRSAA